jgi:hypothetical protein
MAVVHDNEKLGQHPSKRLYFVRAASVDDAHEPALV